AAKDVSRADKIDGNGLTYGKLTIKPEKFSGGYYGLKLTYHFTCSAIDDCGGGRSCYGDASTRALKQAMFNQQVVSACNKEILPNTDAPSRCYLAFSPGGNVGADVEARACEKFGGLMQSTGETGVVASDFNRGGGGAAVAGKGT